MMRLLISLCTEAKIQRSTEAALKNTKQKHFENGNKNLGFGQMSWVLKLGGLSRSRRIENFDLRPINRLIGGSLDIGIF